MQKKMLLEDVLVRVLQKTEPIEYVCTEKEIYYKELAHLMWRQI